MLGPSPDLTHIMAGEKREPGKQASERPVRFIEGLIKLQRGSVRCTLESNFEECKGACPAQKERKYQKTK